MKGDKHYTSNDKALLQSMLEGLRSDKIALTRQKKNIEERIDNINLQQRTLHRMLRRLEEEDDACN